MSEEKVFASEDELGPDEAYKETHLPFRDRWVNVRRLDTPEVARLSYLPDLIGFSLLMSKLQVEISQRAAGEEVTEEVDPGALAAENYRYQAHVAHLAVLKDPAHLDDEPCADCNFLHPPTLWSVRQAARLQQKDLDAITRVALNGDVLEGLRPLSKGETPDDSSELADSGASTQPTSS